VSGWPQKPPLVTAPAISSLPMAWKVAAEPPFALSATFTSSCALVVFG
jgi:hypothetical protein